MIENVKKYGLIGLWLALPQAVQAQAWDKAMTSYRNTRNLDKELMGMLKYGGGIVGGLILLWLILKLFSKKK